jgi:hypothetical protein
VEPSRSTLYRTFLLTALVMLALLGAGLRLPRFLALGVAWSAVLVSAWFVARRPLEGITAARELYPARSRTTKCRSSSPCAASGPRA